MTLHPAIAAAGSLSAHRAHLLLLGIPTLAMATTGLAADLRLRWSRRTPAHRPVVNRAVANRALVTFAAACSLLAVAIHASVAPEHYREDVLFGVFFTVAAGCQLGWAVLVLVRPRRHWLLAGVAGNAAIVALWAYTRFGSLPLGPDAGTREGIGTRDLLATVVEVALVLAVAWTLVGASRARSAGRETAAAAD